MSAILIVGEISWIVCLWRLSLVKLSINVVLKYVMLQLADSGLKASDLNFFFCIKSRETQISLMIPKMLIELTELLFSESSQLLRGFLVRRPVQGCICWVTSRRHGCFSGVWTRAFPRSCSKHRKWMSIPQAFLFSLDWVECHYCKVNSSISFL